ncbi:hypothetical protein [Micromonospora echinofusca]|uniref:hypothetical protein n=1 Tax=Micromonospora echinofusca TaxID=47858 RepID=UPI0033F1E8A7
MTEAARADAIARALAGESLSSIARTSGVSRQAIRGLLRRRGVPARVVGKLTEDQRSEVLQRYQAGASLGQLATAYGITEPAVRGLVIRRGVPLRRVVHTLRHEAFDELTSDACYWIGFLFADGSISYRPKHIPQISVGLAERDRAHLAKLRTFLGSTSAISAPNPTHHSCQFSVRSHQLADRLVALGRYQEPTDARLVESRDFWRGVVDGDGSLGLYRRSRSAPATMPQFRLVGRRHVLEEFLGFLRTQGIGGLSVRPHKSIYTMGTTCGPAERIVALLYSGATVALSRKAETAERMLAAAASSRGPNQQG